MARGTRPEQPDDPGGELNEHCRGGGGQRHDGQEADDLTQGNAVRAARAWTRR